MARNLKLLFLKNNNGANDSLVKFYLHFTQKYYTVKTLGFFRSKLEACFDITKVSRRGEKPRSFRGLNVGERMDVRLMNY